MSFYELAAEQSGYFYLRRGVAQCLTAPHFHSAVELLFCLDGEQEVFIGGERRILQRGDACFADSYVVHAFPKSECNLFVLVGDAQYFRPVFRSFGERIPPAFFRFENERLLAFLYDVCTDNSGNDVGRYERNEGAAKLLLSEIAKSVPFEKRKDNRQTDLVAGILRYASDNLASDLSLKTLSKVFGYSHEHLSRILHRHLGENWNRYLGRLRVRAANTLLRQRPTASVLEIAAECGFDSPNTFYRAYNREYGMPPRLR